MRTVVASSSRTSKRNQKPEAYRPDERQTRRPASAALVLSGSFPNSGPGECPSMSLAPSCRAVSCERECGGGSLVVRGGGPCSASGPTPGVPTPKD
jgi:hypothetical protein